MTIQRIAVLGGGAWGTALAQTCARAGRDVTLWEFDAGNAEHLARVHHEIDTVEEGVEAVPAQPKSSRQSITIPDPDVALNGAHPASG